MTFLTLIWATLVGALLFNEAVDAFVLLGGAVLLTSHQPLPADLATRVLDLDAPFRHYGEPRLADRDPHPARQMDGAAADDDAYYTPQWR